MFLDFSSTKAENYWFSYYNTNQITGEFVKNCILQELARNGIQLHFSFKENCNTFKTVRELLKLVVSEMGLFTLVVYISQQGPYYQAKIEFLPQDRREKDSVAAAHDMYKYVSLKSVESALDKCFGEPIN